ncbi:hypothetical protein [Corynebacterium variabile]|uniref:hypothetical protein n=1 Tax=Corynebacterium variabile TaxID=1727 RepID=UPI003BAEB23D
MTATLQYHRALPPLPSPAVQSIDCTAQIEFADGLIVAHPDLSLVEIGSSWCTPDQIRSLVDAMRHVRKHPYTGEDRELLMVVADVTIESACRAGLIWVDDEPNTLADVEHLEIEAMRAVHAAESR